MLRRRIVRPVRGQATVEFALVLPLLVLVTLIVLQIVVVFRDAVALTAAARSAARRAIVTSGPAAVRAAAIGETHLDPERLSVVVVGDGEPGTRVSVTVRYRAPTEVPVVGVFVGDVQLRERFVVLRE